MYVLPIDAVMLLQGLTIYTDEDVKTTAKCGVILGTGSVSIFQLRQQQREN
jgi:hypothetical protein